MHWLEQEDLGIRCKAKMPRFRRSEISKRKLYTNIGWIAQWNEMIADPEQKIGRPRQLFVGSAVRDVPPLKDRK